MSRILPALIFAAAAAVSQSVTVQDIDGAIRYLVRGVPANPMTDDGARREMATAIHSAALETDVDPYLLTYQMKKESSFLTTARGKMGEVGLGQQHGVTLNRCVRKWKIDMSTVAGQVMCTAKNLQQCAIDCGGESAGLIQYMSGSCKAQTMTTAKKAAHRIRVAMELASKPWEE